MKKITKLTAAITALALASVSAVSIATMDFTAIAVNNEGPYTAWLCLQAGGTSSWDAADEGQVAATIEESGDYSVSYTIQPGGGSESIECMILSTNINAYAFVEEGKDPWVDGTAKIEINSIEIQRTSGDTDVIEYTGPSEGAFNKENDGVSLRMNIYNVWGNNITDITNTPEGGLAEGDTVVVNFTVSGIDEMWTGEGGEGDTTGTTTENSPTTTTTTTTTTSKLARGDYDGDGEITIMDAYNTLLAYSNISAGNDSGMTAEQEEAVDVDGSGSVDIMDAYKILLYYSNQSAGNSVDWDAL